MNVDLTRSVAGPSRLQFESRLQQVGSTALREAQREEAAPQDGVALQQVAVPAEEGAPEAPEKPAEAFSPAADPEFAQAREKLQASMDAAPRSLLHGDGNGEHAWPLSGTGFAAPQVAGAAAVLMQGGMSPVEARAALTAPSSDLRHLFPSPISGAAHQVAMAVNPHAGAAAAAAMPVPSEAPEAGQTWGGRLKQAAQGFWDFGMQGGLIGHMKRKRQAAAPPAMQPMRAPQAPAGPQVRVQMGDITKIPAQALISNINSEGMWWGGIDGAIQGVAGNQFHTQAAEVLQESGLTEGQTVLAEARQPHHGAFDNVLFVVDDGQRPLREVVLQGLRAADQAGMKSVSLPAMRTGVMAGPAGPAPAMREMAAGIKQFLAENPGSLEDIQLVVYKDPTQVRAFQEAMAG